jgi:peptide/nickel transport system ATP-binding protein
MPGKSAPEGGRVSEALLTVEDLRVSFDTQSGPVQAVDGVSFELVPGEVLAIVGESGSGKSVTARAILGLDPPANTRIAGSAKLGGKELIDADDDVMRGVRGERIAMVFQDPMTSFNPVYRIGWQIAEAIRAHRQGVSKSGARERTIELLDAVGIPDPGRRLDDYPHQFSGGMRQRAMIAMALALEPEILIADEPTTALDVTVQAEILSLLEQLNRERGLATILITHDLGVVAEVADRVLVMHEGAIVERGSLDEIFYSPSAAYTHKLLDAVVRLDAAPPLRARRESEPLLEVTDLVKHFPVKRGLLFDREVDRVRAVDGVSLSVRRGETLGLVGESGSGKSTLSRAILQLLAPTSGSVRFEGREIAGLSRRELRPLRREMQMVFQDPYASLNPRRRIGQIVAEPLRLQGELSGAERRREVQGLLDRVGLSAEHYDRFPHEFSGGQRQRIGIARALALRPKLIVADEPVSALDVSIRAQILDLLSELQSELGLTYVFVAHDIAVVRHVSDRIAVMHGGRIVEEGPADAVCERPEDAYTKQLLAAVPIPDPREARARRPAMGPA